PRDRRCLPDDVWRWRRLRPHLHAVVPATIWRATHMRRRRMAWILILIVDVGYIAWGAGVAAWPDHLLGPAGKAILPAGFEGYSGASWSELAGASPSVAGYITVLFRMYGIYCVLFGLMGSA